MMQKNQTYFYEDELTDDFAGISRNQKTIEDDYRYINKSFVFRAFSFLTYRIIMTPIAYFYCKCKFSMKIENRKALNRVKGQGFFLYGNHTQVPGDGYIPTLVTYPVKPYVLVNPDSVALKGTEQFMVSIGAMPLPSRMRGLNNLSEAIEERIADGNCIMIYPEAHIWPYYTKIRPFGAVSFKYPAKLLSPCFCFTTVYKQRKHSNKPQIKVYVDGPFYPDASLPIKKRQLRLHEEMYHTMCERSKESNCEYIRYVKKTADQSMEE